MSQNLLNNLAMVITGAIFTITLVASFALADTRQELANTQAKLEMVQQQHLDAVYHINYLQGKLNK